jgi:UDP-N-acetylglucosamine 2-epimerase (non-hydrolysing)
MIHIVLGTKAQLIKVAPVMVRLRERRVPYNFIFTGQHRATVDEMLDEFGLKRPDVVLYRGDDIVSTRQVIGWMARILWKGAVRRSSIFGADGRGIVLVHGDTFSTLLGALLGRIARLPVGHIEAGLRSFKLFHPFPEELTRLATLRLSHTLYCPGDWAMNNVRNLRREKINTRANTLSDTLRLALRLSQRRDHVPDEPFGLVSLHRYENIFRRDVFAMIIAHLERVAKQRKLLFVLHPPTEHQLRRLGLLERLEQNDRIELRPRYTYFDFVALMEKTLFVITDGGSVQEESSFLGVPCLLMRKATERREGLGENVTLSYYEAPVIDEFANNPERYRRPPIVEPCSPSDIIVDSVLRYS